AFCAAFPSPEYYLSSTAVESAVQKCFQFNIIHPASGLKIDCFVANQDDFDRNQLRRAKAVVSDGGKYHLRMAAPEDGILKKLDYFKSGESEKHVRDICGMLKAEGERIDRDYIRQWAVRKGLTEIWEAVLVRLSTKTP